MMLAEVPLPIYRTAVLVGLMLVVWGVIIGDWYMVLNSVGLFVIPPICYAAYLRRRRRLLRSALGIQEGGSE